MIYFRCQPSMNKNNTRYITDYLQSPCHILDFFTLSNSFFLFFFPFVFFLFSIVFLLFIFIFFLYFFLFSLLFFSVPFFILYSFFFLFFLSLFYIFFGHYYHLHTEGVTQAGNSSKVSHCTAAINDKVKKLAQQ